jgi:CheY-like chemotaxis protein
MDGLAATAAIRAMDRSDAKTVPIIAMTANAYDEDIRVSLQAGMTAHLAKPFEPEVLYATLEKYCAAGAAAPADPPAGGPA